MIDQLIEEKQSLLRQQQQQPPPNYSMTNPSALLQQQVWKNLTQITSR